MKISLEKKHEKRLDVVMEGIDASLANVLRRYCMVRVPVLAIDAVTFYDNTSSLWDEYLAHRVGLLPVITPADLPEETEVAFTLDENGPKVVRSEDMKSNDKEIRIAKEGITIATLATNQHLRLEGKAILGVGTTHAKFQASLASFSFDGKQVKFRLECFHQMPPNEVVLRACDLLSDDIEEILAQLTGKKREKKKPAKKKAAAKKPAKKAAKKTAAKKTTKKAAKKTTKKKK